jgi:TRAP-type C4-dicarboxylate transport system permease small subunit
VLQHASSFTEELARFLLIWIGLLGASFALRTKAHLGIDVLTFRLTGMKKQIVTISVYGLVLLFALVIMVIGGFRLVQLTFSLNQISAAIGIKMGYIYLVLPISGLLFMYYSFCFIIQAITNKPILDMKIPT